MPTGDSKRGQILEFYGSLKTNKVINVCKNTVGEWLGGTYPIGGAYWKEGTKLNHCGNRVHFR